MKACSRLRNVAFVSDRRPGGWTEVEVPLGRFLQTWRGRLVDSEVEMHSGRIMGFGISVALGDSDSDKDSDEGDFKLDLDWIRARRLHASF